ncbi:NADPH-dependent 1-acyldihydroxyacetone phosphate reductase [Colletotrichum tanaceti]|uniref:NADPH-dependent 1-acyldihydroxyacetone phosphate reductase n=1 Tax=Colletotrichum tanaceti TaxID=1306861 RepID=A0A4V6Y9D1_9PEZI|nr:NADPH-dependent 1-acyldihydroxyacetone phosphate reductase [Colletotrichum tanaceti]TKW50906.1 NADPH-dependent 1-acyldihydroxyacetone phosphate reductase [Colletotrichum tanaceti]
MAASTKRSVLVTGCSAGGSGNALALEFAARGLRVFATARSLKSINDLAEKGIETFALDVTSQESITLLQREIAKRTGGKLDILFNNAGTMYEAPAIESDPQQVRKMFDANVFGLFDVVTAFAPLLIAAAAASGSKTEPVIVNVSSILARLPYPFAAAYNASKAAVSAYSDTLRLELGPLGVRVVTLFMGEVSTRLMSSDNIRFDEGSLYADVEHKVKERSANHAKASVAPDVFAKQVVSKVVGGRNESYIWKGTNAFLIWLLDAIGPRKVFDSIMKGAVGFNDKALVKKINERGKRSAAS